MVGVVGVVGVVGLGIVGPGVVEARCGPLELPSRHPLEVALCWRKGHHPCAPHHYFAKIVILAPCCQ